MAADVIDHFVESLEDRNLIPGRTEFLAVNLFLNHLPDLFSLLPSEHRRDISDHSSPSDTETKN
jgi:hypothetical protein